MIQRLSFYEKSTVGSLMDEKNRTVAIVKSISDPLIVLDNNYKIVMATMPVNSLQFYRIKHAGQTFSRAVAKGAFQLYYQQC